MFVKNLVAIGAAVAATSLCVEAQDSSCRKLKDIYTDPKEMCELMWSGAFEYVPTNSANYSLAYTMWFFDEKNPNDAVTARRNELGLHGTFNNTDVCHLDSLHKTAPTPEPDTFTECHPWREASCCSDDLDLGPEKLNTLYGDQYRWDKCGPISQECERFFVQEGCFYQCDANIGIFRKAHPDFYAPSDDNDHSWRVAAMPIKGDYCDSWYAACAHDYFCVDDKKEFFSCPRDRPTETDTAAIVAVVLGVLAAILWIAGMYIVYREYRGVPIFLKKVNVNGFNSNAASKQDEEPGLAEA